MSQFENLLMALLGNGVNLFKTVYICFGSDCLFISATGFLECKKVRCNLREAFMDTRGAAARRRKLSGASDVVLCLKKASLALYTVKTRSKKGCFSPFLIVLKGLVLWGNAQIRIGYH